MAFDTVPQWHPLMLAQKLATLHNISGGRAFSALGGAAHHCADFAVKTQVPARDLRPQTLPPANPTLLGSPRAGSSLRIQKGILLAVITAWSQK
jgi:hypothetical protein